MRRLGLTVEGKVTGADVDPGMVALNESIKDARVKLAAAQEAAEENWASFNNELDASLDALRADLAGSED